MRLPLAFIAVLLFVSAEFSLAADVNPALLARIQDYYTKLQAFESEYQQTLNHRESGSLETRNGTIKFRKPLSIRWESNAPNAELLVISEKEIWDYIPDEEIAYRYSPAAVQDSRNIIQVITGQSKLDRDFDVRYAGDEDRLARLTLFPKEPTTQMVEATLWVDLDTGQIRRAKIIDFYGNTNDVRLDKFKPEAKLQDSDFRFSPPDGVETEDLTESDNPQRQLLK